MTYDLKSSFPTLRNAPITEALIDIQQLPPEDVAQLRKFHEALMIGFRTWSNAYGRQRGSFRWIVRPARVQGRSDAGWLGDAL